MVNWPIALLVFIITLGLSLKSYAQQDSSLQCRDVLSSPRVMFIVPADKENVFWQDVVSYTKLASEQLKITLDIHYLKQDHRNRFNHAKSINQILTSSPKPDYLITFLTQGLELEIIERITQDKIFLFSFNAPLTASMIQRIGVPRDRFPYWIGHISPDEISAGYDLADHLFKVDKQKRESNQDKANIIAISGGLSSSVGQMREQGLVKRLDQDENALLLQLVNADWSYEQTRFMMRKLLQRHEKIDIIWAASDLISMAVVDEIQASKPQIINTVTIGSIDWTHEVKPYLERHDVAVTYGGHVFEAGWVIPLIFDHYNQQDYLNELGGVILSKMKAITADNSHLLDKSQLSGVNFRDISKCFTGVDKEYQFNAHTQLNSQLTPPLHSDLKSQLDPHLQDKLKSEIEQKQP